MSDILTAKYVLTLLAATYSLLSTLGRCTMLYVTCSLTVLTTCSTLNGISLPDKQYGENTAEILTRSESGFMSAICLTFHEAPKALSSGLLRLETSAVI